MADTPPQAYTVSVPRYIINLDLPPEERWNQVVDDYKDKWKAVDEYGAEMVNTMIGPILGPAVDAIIKTTLKSLVGRTHYSLEMKAIAKRSKMDLGRLVLMQHIYEASAACTSMVIQGENCPMHIRSMDWEMDILKPLTIEIQCEKNGQTVFIATTWAGFLGVFTGMRPGQWSCTLNFRLTQNGSFWSNLKSMLKGSIPSGFLMRSLLESEPSFDLAVDKLATTKLVAPCYYTICGSKPGEGALITRDPTGELNRWVLMERGNIVQTNIDHWSDGSEVGDIMLSCARRENALSAIDKAPKPITHEWLWELISIQPICNDITIYGTLMVPSEQVFISRLPDDQRVFTPRTDAKRVDPAILIPAGASFEQYLQLVTIPPLPPFTCTRCQQTFGPYNNSKGECTHTGSWHATFDDCSYLRCGAGLGISRIGQKHWSCCFSTDSQSTICSASPAHVRDDPLPEEEEQNS